jgi:DNA polymerase bacteriophage-type
MNPAIHKELKKKRLFIDFESRGYADLNGKYSVGLYNYMTHPQTELVMCAYGYGDSDTGPLDVKMWRMWTSEPMPNDLRGWLEDPEVDIVAFNSSFERHGLRKIKVHLGTARFQDPQPSARMLSLPADLESVSDILGLSRDLGKDKRGKALINLFCKPVIKKAKKPTKKNPAGVPERVYYNDWDSHPKEWAEFAEYCKQDVRAEREVTRREILLGVFPLPEFERAVWLFDQKVNDRGIHVDRQFVTNGLALGIRAKTETKRAMNQLTGLENSNSHDQLLPWVTARGYDDESLEKDAVKTALKFNTKLTPECRKILELRLNASSTTYTKLAAVLRQLCDDDRLRGQFIYMGSPRCGRWSGNAVQMHNMARPEPLFEDEVIVEEARSLIYKMDFDGIIKRFGKVLPGETDYGSVLATIKNTIRTIFEAEKGKRLNVCDLNAIETRDAAYLSQCEPLNQVFLPRPGKPNGNCPYLSFAGTMNGIPYEVLEADYHSKDKAIKAEAKRKRQVAKPAVLGCVYELSGGRIETDPRTKRLHKTGLLDYAEKMGIDLSEKLANDSVRAFREIYKEIKQAWYDLGKIIEEVLEEGTIRVKREWGPGGIVKFDKLVLTREGATPKNILRIQLPSGRYLHYFDARIEIMKKPWKNRETGEDVYGPTFVYVGTNQDTHQWGNHITSHGGKILENIVQGSSRDILALKLLMFEAANLFVVGHVHDEGITETEDDPIAPGLAEMDAIMRESISWMPGFLLGCDGFEDKYYHK